MTPSIFRSVSLWHFSLAGAGSGTPADAAAQVGNAPDDAMAALTQEVVAALAACKADPDCAESGELQRRITQAEGLAFRAIKNGIDRACKRCLQHELWGINRMAELVRWASLCAPGLFPSRAHFPILIWVSSC
jgi:hypothetical protein